MFLSEVSKRLFAYADPSGVKEALRMKNVDGIKRIDDDEERLRLCCMLLPMAECMIAVSGSSTQGHLVKAAALEHVGYAELCNANGQQRKASAQLRSASLSWGALQALN